MTIINCSRQFAVDNPLRRPLYRIGDDETLHEFTGQEHKDGMTYFVPALVDEEDLDRCVELSNQLSDLKDKIDEIKANFGMDADAYNSVDDHIVQYSLTHGNATIFAKDSVKVAVLHSKDVANCKVENLIVPNEVTYKVGDDWKNVVTAILTHNVGKCSLKDTIHLINEDMNGTESSEKALTKKLRKKYDTNVKLFTKTYNIPEDQARYFAQRIEQARAYDELCTLAQHMGCDNDTTTEFVIKHMVAMIQHSIGLTTSTV